MKADEIKETIAMLKALKEQAKKSGKDTAVIDAAIEALEQDALWAKIEEMAETIIKADKAGENEVMAY